MEEKLAEILVEYSLGITPSDVVVIDYQNHTRKLFYALKKKIHDTGAQLETFPQYLLQELPFSHLILICQLNSFLLCFKEGNFIYKTYHYLVGTKVIRIEGGDLL